MRLFWHLTGGMPFNECVAVGHVPGRGAPWPMRLTVSDYYEFMPEKSAREVDRRFWDVAVRDGGKCVYCSLDGAIDHRILRNFCLDHLIPRNADGGESLGSEEYGNLVLSCHRCNGDKGSFNPATTATDPGSRDSLKLAAREYVERQQGRYYRELHTKLNEKPRVG